MKNVNINLMFSFLRAGTVEMGGWRLAGEGAAGGNRGPGCAFQSVRG